VGAAVAATVALVVREAAPLQRVLAPLHQQCATAATTSNLSENIDESQATADLVHLLNPAVALKHTIRERRPIRQHCHRRLSLAGAVPGLICGVHPPVAELSTNKHLSK